MLRMFAGWTSRDVLILAVALAVLPLLPDAPVDPWQVLNLRKLWLLTVLVMVIGAAGQMAQQLFGARTGLLLAGFAGGFASSAATIAGLGARARQQPALAPACAGGGVLSNVSTVVQLGIVVGVLSPSLLAQLLPALCLAGAVIGVFAVLAAQASRVQMSAQATPVEASPNAALAPRRALLFMLIVATVLLMSAWIQAWLGDAALDATLALSGLADVHAAAASAAQLVASGRIAVEGALPGVVLAFAANSLVKLGLAWASGGRRYMLRLLPGITAMVLTFALALWLLR